MSLAVKNLDYEIGNERILDQISLEIKEGEFVGLVGPNGCGKSTLLKHIYRTYKPKGQTVFLDGKDIMDLSAKKLAGELAVMAQENQLEFDFTVRDMVMFGRYAHKKFLEGDTAKDRELCEKCLREVGLSGYETRSYLSLSGGEKQRVLLARVLMQESRYIVLDEPTNHLDIDSKEILERAVNHFEGTVLYVSHDRYFINRTATRILDLTQKQLVNYIGNYDYYLEKKEANELAQLTAPVIDTAGQPADTASDSKLTWQQQKEEQARLRKKQNALNKVEKEIAELEEKNESLGEQLSDPKNGTDIALLQKLASEKEANDERLLVLMEEWENLAEN